MNTSAIWTAANLPAAFIAATAITQHDLVVLSGTLNEFTEMIDTIDSYTDKRILFTTASGVVDSANLTFNSGTGALGVPIATIATSATVAGSPILTQADEGHGNGIDADTLDGQEGSYYASESDFTAASGVLQAQITSNDADIAALDTEISTCSGVLQGQITSNDGDITTLDSKIDTASGTLQSQITSNDADILSNSNAITALDSELTTASGYLQGQITTNTNAIAALDTTYATDAELTATSGVLQGNIDTNTAAIAALDTTYATDAELLTVSGVLSAEIDADITAHHAAGSTDHDDRYYTEAEVDALTWTESDITDLDKYTTAEVDGKWTTWSGTIDHNTILNNHNLTTDIDHDQLTNYSVAEHRTINDSGSGSTDLWSADKISTEIDSVVVSGTVATSSGTGTAGAVQWDSDYIYVCVATDTWKRASLTSW